MKTNNQSTNIESTNIKSTNNQSNIIESTNIESTNIESTNNNINSELREYNGFIINNDHSKKMVDIYYEQTINPPNDENIFGIDNIESLDLPNELCMFILDNLIYNKYAMHYCIMNESSLFTNNYLSLVKQLYISIFKKLSDELSKAERIPHKAEINFIFCENIVKYRFIFTHPLLRNQFYQFWRKINKMCILNSINNGCVISWLTLLAICPKMVNNDCYPILNKEGSIYKNINWGFINKNIIFKPLLDHHLSIIKEKETIV
jgi:hypothetical protein